MPKRFNQSTTTTNTPLCWLGRRESTKAIILCAHRHTQTGLERTHKSPQCRYTRGKQHTHTHTTPYTHEITLKGRDKQSKEKEMTTHTHTHIYNERFTTSITYEGHTWPTTFKQRSPSNRGDSLVLDPPAVPTMGAGDNTYAHILSMRQHI